MTFPDGLPFLRQIPQSLRVRLGLFAFIATLVSSLAVAWTTTRAMESFLRSRVEDKLPAALGQTRSRLDLWFSQRQLDIQVFARSSIVVANIHRLAQGRPASSARSARQEVADYLDYVLKSFPQYSALFVLDRQGRLLIWAGEPRELDAPARAHLKELPPLELVPAGAPEKGTTLVVSAGVGAPKERPHGSLHALVRVETLGGELAIAELGESGRALLVEPSGHALAGWPPPVPETPVVLPDAPGADERVRDYLRSDGERVVGAALPLGHFDWILLFEQPYDEAFAPIGAILRRTLGLNLGIVVLLSLVAFRVASSIAQPVSALAGCARRLRDGDLEVEVPEPATRDELGELTRAFSEMTTALKDARAEVELRRAEVERANQRLRAQNEELQRANEVLEQLAITDGLTRLHNHRFFQDQLTREIKRCERAHTDLALVLVDIDDFKKLNDGYGHVVGDAVLKALAEVLGQETRDHDLVARYGGEEFAILAPDTDLEGAVALAEKLRTAVASTPFPGSPDDGSIRITVSVGVAEYRGDRAAFFHAADRALYEAKAAGKDCVIAATDDGFESG